MALKLRSARLRVPAASKRVALLCLLHSHAADGPPPPASAASAALQPIITAPSPGILADFRNIAAYRAHRLIRCALSVTHRWLKIIARGAQPIIYSSLPV